jgi:hypothetical protein
MRKNDMGQVGATMGFGVYCHDLTLAIGNMIRDDRSNIKIVRTKTITDKEIH